MQNDQINTRLIITAAIAALLATSGCAVRPLGANHRPLIDSLGVDGARYEADLTDCQRYASQVAGAAHQAAASAVAGVLVGTLLAVAGGSRYSRNQHAAVGAVVGAASGGASGERDQRVVVNRCMAGRGYKVLQ